MCPRSVLLHYRRDEEEQTSTHPLARSAGTRRGAGVILRFAASVVNHGGIDGHAGAAKVPEDAPRGASARRGLPWSRRTGTSGGTALHIRYALTVVASGLLAFLIVTAPSVAAAQAGHGEPKTQAHDQTLSAWWAQVKPDYVALRHDLTAVAESVGTYTAHRSLSTVSAACHKVVVDARVLLERPPVPDRKISGRWHSGLRLYQKGGRLCVRGSTPQTSRLLGQAGHDFGKARGMLRSATHEITTRLTTTT